MPRPVGWWFLVWPVLVLAVYGWAFFLPAATVQGRITSVRTGNGPERPVDTPVEPLNLDGRSCFSWAWTLGRLSWYANPLLWAGCLLLALRRGFLPGLAGLAALALGLVEVISDLPPWGDGQTTFREGYWFWLAGMALLAWVGFALRHPNRRARRPRSDAEW